MFQHIAGPEICPKCKQSEEEMFQRVKQYLRENPGANMYEVNRETEVSAALIEKFLRQGRLEVTSDSPIGLTCERCGRKMTTGRFCNSCKNEMTNDLNEAKRMLTSPEKHDTDAGPRMRYLKSDNIK